MRGSRRDLATVLVALGHSSEWLYADEIRGLLKAHLGIEAKPQQVAGWLTRMTKEDAPRFERSKSWNREWRYRVTRYARTEVVNKMPGLRTLR